MYVKSKTIDQKLENLHLRSVFVDYYYLLIYVKQHYIYINIFKFYIINQLQNHHDVLLWWIILSRKKRISEPQFHKMTSLRLGIAILINKFDMFLLSWGRLYERWISAG